MVRKALYSLPFDTKALLLLRDQLHLSYKGIAAVLHVPESKAKIRTTQARSELRQKIEEVLSRAR